MPVGSRFAQPPKPATIRSIKLPDEQIFSADKLAHITISSATLTILLSGVTDTPTYTAGNPLLAWLLMKDIYRAYSSSTQAETLVTERGIDGVSISAVVPDPIDEAGLQAVALTGAGFLQVQNPVVAITVGGSGGLTWYDCTNVVVVDDLSVTFITPALGIGAVDITVVLASGDRENIAATASGTAT